MQGIIADNFTKAFIKVYGPLTQQRNYQYDTITLQSTVLVQNNPFPNSVCCN